MSFSIGFFYPNHGICFRVQVSEIITTVCTRCGQVWHTVSQGISSFTDPVNVIQPEGNLTTLLYRTDSSTNPVNVIQPERNLTTLLYQPHTNALVKSQPDFIHHPLRRDVESKNISELDSNWVPNAVNHFDASPNIPEVEGKGEPHQHNHSDNNPDEINPQGEDARNVSHASPNIPEVEGKGEPHQHNHSDKNATQPGTTGQSTRGENNTSWITYINTSVTTDIIVVSSSTLILAHVLGLSLVVAGILGIFIFIFIWFYKKRQRLNVSRKMESRGFKSNRRATLIDVAVPSDRNKRKSQTPEEEEMEETVKETLL